MIKVLRRSLRTRRRGNVQILDWNLFTGTTTTRFSSSLSSSHPLLSSINLLSLSLPSLLLSSRSLSELSSLSSLSGFAGKAASSGGKSQQVSEEQREGERCHIVNSLSIVNNHHIVNSLHIVNNHHIVSSLHHAQLTILSMKPPPLSNFPPSSPRKPLHGYW